MIMTSYGSYQLVRIPGISATVLLSMKPHSSPLPAAKVNSPGTKYWSQWIPWKELASPAEATLPLCFYVLPTILQLHSLAGSQTTHNLNKGIGLNLEKTRLPTTWTCLLVILKQFSVLLKFWIQQCCILLLVLWHEAGFNPFFFSFLSNTLE